MHNWFQVNEGPIISFCLLATLDKKAMSIFITPDIPLGLDLSLGDNSTSFLVSFFYLKMYCAFFLFLFLNHSKLKTEVILWDRRDLNFNSHKKC